MFTLSNIAADIVKNACQAGANTVELEITELGNEFRFLVRDNGRGMSRDEAQRATEPIGTGTGIPFLIQIVNEASGGWDIHTEKGSGTTVSAWFDAEKPETPPAGDMALLFRTVLGFAGPDEFVIRRIRKTGDNDIRYEIRKSELSAALGGLNEPESQILLGTYLTSLERG